MNDTLLIISAILIFGLISRFREWLSKNKKLLEGYKRESLYIEHNAKKFGLDFTSEISPDQLSFRKEQLQSLVKVQDSKTLGFDSPGLVTGEYVRLVSSMEKRKVKLKQISKLYKRLFARHLI